MSAINSTPKRHASRLLYGNNVSHLPSLNSPPPPLLDESNPFARRVSMLLTLLVIAAVITFCFVASSICITVALSAFLAILLDPVVEKLDRMGLGRGLASGIVVLLGIIAMVALAYVTYQKTSRFIGDLPRYSSRIRQVIGPLTQKMERVRQNTEALNPPDPARKVQEVKIKEPTPSLPSFLIRGFGSIAGGLLMAAVVPFLVFFILAAKEQINTCFVTMFEGKIDCPALAVSVSEMTRGFVMGNVVIGGVLAGATVLTLLLLGLHGAFTLGIVSGFLNMLPYLGLPLAIVVPLTGGLLQFQSVTPYAVMAVAITMLHLVVQNLFVPKFIGSRVRVGAVALMVGMLFWAWLWGVAGLLMAVPLTALLKIIADAHPSLIHLSNLLAENPRPVSRWARWGKTVTRIAPYWKGRQPQRSDRATYDEPEDFSRPRQGKAGLI